MWKRSSLLLLGFTSFASLALYEVPARAEVLDVGADTVIDADAAPADAQDSGSDDGGHDGDGHDGGNDGGNDGGPNDVLVEAGHPADSGVDGAPRDAPFEEVRPADSGTPPRNTPDEDDGCGCRIGSGKPGSAGLFTVLGALAGVGLTVRRRRRR